MIKQSFRCYQPLLVLFTKLAILFLPYRLSILVGRITLNSMRLFAPRTLILQFIVSTQGGHSFFMWDDTVKEGALVSVALLSCWHILVGQLELSMAHGLFGIVCKEISVYRVVNLMMDICKSMHTLSPILTEHCSKRLSLRDWPKSETLWSTDCDDQ